MASSTTTTATATATATEVTEQESTTTTTTTTTGEPSTSNDDTTNNVDTSGTSTSTKGVAGRIDYAQWEKVADSLAKETDLEMTELELEERKKLGLDGKYARSQAEAEERIKAKQVKQVKKTLERYRKREEAVIMTCLHNRKIGANEIVRITRHELDAGTRVVRVEGTTGISTTESTVVLTQDLSSLESRMAANAMQTVTKADHSALPVPPATTKPTATTTTEPTTSDTISADASDASDADASDASDAKEEQPEHRAVFGIIKAFFSGVENCTILIKCKIISGMIEFHHCSNLIVKVMGPEATVATVQMDLSQNIQLEFHDAPSGKNTPVPYKTEPSLYWGQDKDDRVFHAGVTNLRVILYRDGMIDMETKTDYIQAGALPVGNATAEEMQFVTSVVNGELMTESVVRTGATTGQQVRAMTPREMEEQEAKRKRAAELATYKADDMIRVTDKQGNPVVVKTPLVPAAPEELCEVLSPAVQAIVDECLVNKKRGNEAFGAGEYAQAILLYSLALDKAEELGTEPEQEFLFPRDVVYSNRSACFLKLGQHEKAEHDAAVALQINPDNLKALFRRGLALHALHKYTEALPLLASAHQKEPHNQQIKQALKFCEVRMEQEYRKRMEGGNR